MARYGKIDKRMYGDAKYRRLSPSPPCGQALWTYLLTGPHTTSLPGLSHVGEHALSETLRWPIDGFRSAFAEISREGLAEADWASRVLWVPNAIKYNAPESPNVVLSWHGYFDEVPECSLKLKAHEGIAQFLARLGDTYSRAWLSTSVRHVSYKVRKPTADAVKKRDGSKCRYCGEDVSWTDRRSLFAGTYDHVDPTGPGTIDNVVVACNRCNSRKGFRTPEQAAMPLLAVGSSRTSDLGQTWVKPANQEQEQEQEQTLSPAEAGKGIISNGTNSDRQPDSERMARRELLASLAKVTGLDPKLAGSHLGRVVKDLRSADNPYVAADVLALESILSARKFTLPLTPGTVSKYIGWTRTLPSVEAAQKAAQADRVERRRRQIEADEQAKANAAPPGEFARRRKESLSRGE